MTALTPTDAFAVVDGSGIIQSRGGVMPLLAVYERPVHLAPPHTVVKVVIVPADRLDELLKIERESLRKSQLKRKS